MEEILKAGNVRFELGEVERQRNDSVGESASRGLNGAKRRGRTTPSQLAARFRGQIHYNHLKFKSLFKVILVLVPANLISIDSDCQRTKGGRLSQPNFLLVDLFSSGAALVKATFAERCRAFARMFQKDLAEIGRGREPKLSTYLLDSECSLQQESF